VDRETRTLWNQLTGRAVLGPLAAEPRSLAMKPSVVTRWADWRARHPETRVLALDTGHDRPYQPGAAYAGYFASETTMFPVRRARRELAEKARVFGLARGGAARAWPLDALLAARVVNDAVAGEPVVLVAEGPAIAVEGVSVRSGPARYEAGAAVRAYRREGHRFAPAPPDAPSAAGSALVDARGRRWRVEEEALVGQDGARLARVPGVLAYWFGWSAFHPRTELWSAPGRELREAGTEPARGSDEDPREERP